MYPYLPETYLASLIWEKYFKSCMKCSATVGAVLFAGWWRPSWGVYGGASRKKGHTLAGANRFCYHAFNIG
jgi:hypothetical protein